MPFRDRDRGCPVCGIRLEDAEVRGRRYQRCPSCSGSWVTNAVFDAVLAETTAGGIIPRLEQVDRTSGRACPDCGDPMSALLLEHMDVERCARHGVWLDRGELQQAMLMASEPPWTRTGRRG